MRLVQGQDHTEVYLGPHLMKVFWKNDERLLGVNCFCKNVPS